MIVIFDSSWIDDTRAKRKINKLKKHNSTARTNQNLLKYLDFLFITSRFCFVYESIKPRKKKTTNEKWSVLIYAFKKNEF